MTRCFLIAPVLLCLASTTFAQPATSRILAVATKQPAGNAKTAQIVTVDVVVASVHHTQGKPVFDAKASGDELLDQVNDLKADGKLATYNRLSAAALEGDKAMAQLGSSVPVVSGRSSYPGRGASKSYSQTSVGTMIQVVSKVIGGSVVTQLQLEESRLVPAPKPEDAEAQAEPPSTASLTIDTTVAILPGKASLVSLREAATGDKATSVIVLVEARTSPSGKGAGEANAGNARAVNVYYLKFAQAEQVQRTIQGLTGGRPVIATDARTNALIVQGDAKELKEIEALLKVLDKAVQGKPEKR